MKTILNIGTESLVMLLCGLLICSPQLVFAQAPVASGATNTEVTEARNGVPVVNIATPSASGLSHNTFTSYNVDTKGLVLNNGDTSQQFRQSQLAGQVAANQNLAVGNQARIILNEVTGNNRSLLAGFTEVLGGKADIIVANPFGITSNGAGFINTDRVSLVTGTPNITGGVLNNFKVYDGDILITGTGLNASAQQLLDLVSQKITVDGQVNAQTLNLIAGRNNWDYTTGAATVWAGDEGGQPPIYGIDSSALGGMYAGRISLKSTENGVGVRLLGNAAATADDFSITSDGRIELRSQLSAARDLSITSTIAGTDVVKATDASLTAGRNLGLYAISGGATLNGGVLVAGNNLVYDLGTLIDTATNTAITDNNKRYGTTVTLNGTGAWDFNGVSYGAGSSLSLTATGLSLGSSAATTLSTGGTLDLNTSSGDLVLADAALQSVGELTLTSSNGALTFGNASKVKSTTSALIMSALTSYTNAGIITSAAGNVSIRANDAIANTGTIYANGLLDIADRDGVWTTGVEYTDWGPVTVNRYIDVTNSVTNTGTLQGGTLSLLTSALSVTDGGNVESAGDMNLGVLDQLTIGSGSRIVAATSGVGTATIRGNSDYNVTPYPGGVGAPSGTYPPVDSNRKRFLSLTNFGTLSSGQYLNLLGNGIENTTSGSIGAMNNLALDTSGGLDNAGRIISETGLLQVLTNSSLSNTGRMLGSTVDIQADTLSVTGGGSIEGTGDLTIVATNQLDIGGVGDTTSSILAATSGTGTGNISSLKQVYVSSVYAGSSRWYGTLNNYGVLFSGNDLVIGGKGVNNQSTGGISALRNLTLTDGGVDYVNNRGTLYAGQNMEIYGYDSANYGEAYAGRNMSWDISRNLQNYAPVNAGGNVLLSSGIIANTSTIVSGGTLSLYASRPEIDVSRNSGTLTAPTITLFSNGRFLNTGTIRGGVVNVTGAGILNSGTGTQEIGSPTGVTTTSSPSNSSTPDAVTAVTTAFPGLNLSLPSNPNGMFIPAKNPNSGYLIESNPLYTNIDNFLGSDYLAEKYNLNTDELINRLGDAVYETYLVQQQLISLAGTNLLKGYENEKEQMRGLMDQAGSQSASLGLTYGKALTASQQAQLTGDMVWMVETTVNGQKVLAPVVYLAASTRELFTPGSGVIAADKINMDVFSLTNTGGGVISAQEMNIVTRGNITNVGSTIKGGDVSLTSTEGSIINQTKVQRVSDSNDTRIGKQASIESTGALKVDAAKDITNLGARMSAGGDASLEAGRNVTFDTVKETTYSGSRSSGGNIFVRTSTTETSRSTKQVKSGLTSGGNLSVKAKNDISLAGTDVEAKGSVTLDAGDNINIIARENTSSSNKTTTKDGLFVSGGLYGAEKLTTETFSSKNVGTSIKAGKDVSLDAGKTVTIQGSGVQATDNIDVSAEAVKVLAGKDVDRVTTKKESTSILSINLLGERSYKANAEAEASLGDMSAKAGASAKGSRPSAEDAAAGIKSSGSSEASAKASAAGDRPNPEDASGSSSNQGTEDAATAGGKVGLNAKANAKVGAEFEGNLELFGVDAKKDTTSIRVDETTKAVGSTFGAGKNIRITARKKVTLEGAKVNAKGDIDLSGQDVDILAAEDKHSISRSTSTTKGGVYFSKDFKVKVDANIKNETVVGTDGVKIEKGIGGSGGYGSTETTDVFRTKTIGVVTTDTKNVGSSLTSGGDLRISSGNKLTVQGSDIKGGKDVEIKAKNMEFLAGKDSHKTETTTLDIRAGAYVGNNVEAGVEVGAGAGVSGTGANAKVKAEAKVEVKAGMGVQGKVAVTRKTESNSKARVSTITSGSGSITRTAEKSITDVGTDIDAAGDFNQSSKTFTSKAAKDTSTKTSFSTTNSAKLGVYAGAAASANVDAGVNTSEIPEAPDAGAKAKVTAGVNAAYSGKMSNETETSTTAVVSSIKSGGRIKSVTTEKTSLEGTLLDGSKGVELEAGSLDYSAAQDTTAKTSTSGSVDASAELGVGVDATKAVAVDVELAGDFKGNTKSASTSTAVAGGIISAGDISIKTKGDTRLEGTSLTSVGDTNLAAGGDMTFDAARDTAKSNELGVEASASLTTSKGKNALGIGAKAAGGFKLKSAQSSDAKVGSVNTGGKLNISAGKTASFEGTTIDAGGDATISGKKGVTMSAAKSTSSKQSVEVGGKVNLSGAKKTKDSETTKERKIGGSLEVKLGSEKKSTAVGGKVKSAGDLKILSGKDVTLVGTELEAGNKASIKAGGSVNMKAAESTSESQSFGLNLSGEAKSKTTTKAPGGKAGDKKTPATTSKSTPAKTRNSGTGGTQGSDGSKKNDTALSKWQKNQSALLKELKEKKATGTKNKTTGTGTEPAGTTKKQETGPQKETEKEKGFGLQIQTGKSSTKKGGSIKAGAGGVEIDAGGGDVNLEGVKIETSGDANISAKKDVNMTAAKSTESSFDLSLRAEDKQKTKPPSTGEKTKDTKKKDTKSGPAGKETAKGHFGLHIDSAVTDSQKSEIKTDGKLNISSGGKTSLKETEVKATGGENITAGGGSDRKIP